jgi:two-component system CheB/CheR fusion protein
VGTNTDIHDQKLFAEALQASEDYFKELANEVPFMIWKVDEQGRANYVNKTWIDFTGLSFNESIGDYWLEALHPEDRVRENITFPEAFKLRKSYHSKFRLKRKDGVYRWVMNQCHPLLNPKFSGYIGSLTDITEQELEQQQTTSLIERMDEFMSIASHELKTPITSMKGYLQIAERITEKDKVRLPVHSYIEKANKQVNKLTYLVEDLLNVTKIQAGKIDFAYSEFKINEVIFECIEQLQQNFHTHEIVTDECVDVKVYADRSRIEQVIVNIISNAVKYSPSANKVIINCTHNSNFIKISVTDFGIGIPHDKIPFIFDRFFRVRESVQTLSGLGLGLYISSEIVKRHNGNIGVLSEEGRGSTVWFTLPTNTWTKENI